jgi:hypothetical protein
MRYGLRECEHGAPGGSVDTCALCRVVAARLERRADLLAEPDPRMAAAGADR